MSTDLKTFLSTLAWDDIPPEVQEFSRLLLLDLLGVAIAGSGTELHQAVSRYAKRNHTGQCRALISDLTLSPEGAALLGGMTIDAIDAHDGHRLTKGHVGCAMLPALLAVIEDAKKDISGVAFLTLLIAGYEIGSRAGMALHKTASDYHTSGAWNAVNVAALTAHVLKLPRRQFDHALGIAEYHGPRSQMMRVIEHPTMLKDGSGWGGMAGVSAGYLAAEGFTGAPAVLVLADDVADIWASLGASWETMNQYLKAFPVCRWAQPAVQAALDIQAKHKFAVDEIESVSVRTFTEGACLWQDIPADTEQAQYAIGLPVAAALVRGQVGLAEITPPALSDPDLRRVVNAITFHPAEHYDARFPAERWADIAVTLTSGATLEGPETSARGDPETQLAAVEIIEKFHVLGSGVFRSDRLAMIQNAVFGLDGTTASFKRLTDLLYAAPN